MQALLGINENGDLKIYINAHRELNEIGPRCERGIPLPEYKDIDDSNALECLRAIQDYYRKDSQGTIRGGSNIKSKSKGGKAAGLKSVRGSTFGKV